MFQHVSMHLKNIDDFIRIKGGNIRAFKIIDRKMILSGFTTSVSESKNDSCVGKYTCKKDGKEQEFVFLLGTFGLPEVIEILSLSKIN